MSQLGTVLFWLFLPGGDTSLNQRDVEDDFGFGDSDDD